VPGKLPDNGRYSPECYLVPFHPPEDANIVDDRVSGSRPNAFLAPAFLANIEEFHGDPVGMHTTRSAENPHWFTRRVTAYSPRRLYRGSGR